MSKSSFMNYISNELRQIIPNQFEYLVEFNKSCFLVNISHNNLKHTITLSDDTIISLESYKLLENSNSSDYMKNLILTIADVMVIIRKNKETIVKFI